MLSRLKSWVAPVICLSFLIGCATFKKFSKPEIDPSAKVIAKAPAGFNEALVLLEDKKYGEAVAKFEIFLRDNIGSQYYQLGQFNEGRAYEGLGHFAEAGEKYRHVVEEAPAGAAMLKAQALYRLSFCYEALGDDQRTVATLVDAFARRQNLPPEVGSAELPARLAAAYSRVGNFNQALAFYETAEVGIKNLRRDSKKPLPDWLPQTLYFMGHVSLRKISWDDFEVAVRPLGRAQGYLLQAAEVSGGEWPGKAAAELKTLYSDFFETISHPPQATDTDSLVEKRKIQERQWFLARLLLKATDEAKLYKLADTGEATSRTEPLIKFIEEVHSDLAGILAQERYGSDITDEAKERKQEIRGKTVDSSGALEHNKKLKPTSLPEKKADKPTKEKTDNENESR